MLTITLPQRLQILAAYGYDVVTTPSPLCERIWRRAQDEGLALGELYVLRSPIGLGCTPRSAGPVGRSAPVAGNT